ncbi:Rho-binding antiterminator [Alkalimarinus sediminis]|uniref:Rho-binding antiterminator n=1 Tax=Alkalimarinus sediminis TaxID=1632866 RepID=A0A9E8HKL2_9ALTE|nr:Rho-binding antiterminator [Alkalimarinus sediminis]UZW74418.1 Rho-binding antiterminator [Alkalimarinus sediminis]
MSNILRCDLHDYLEIACLYQYQTTLVLSSGEQYSGVPKTTITKNRDGVKYEVLVVDCEGGQVKEIELLRLKSMHVETPHAKFTDVSFI